MTVAPPPLTAGVIPSMYIAEIIYPGTWLDIDDRDIAFELQGMLHHLEDRVAEAAIALTMFESSRNIQGDPRGEWEGNAQIRQEVDDQLRAEVGDVYYRDFEKFRLESERRALKRKAELGIVPRAYACHDDPPMQVPTLLEEEAPGPSRSTPPATWIASSKPQESF